MRLPRPSLGRALPRARSRAARHRVRQARRFVAGATAGLGVWAALGLAFPAAAPAGTAVLVAVRDLSVGEVVTAGDVAVARHDPATVPARAVSESGAVLGRPVAAPVSAGEVITSSRVAGPSALLGRPADEVAMGLPVLEPGLLAVLAPGHRILILRPGRAQPVAEATVLSVASEPDTARGFGLGAAPGTSRLVVAIPAGSAPAVADAVSPGPDGRAGVVVALLR